MMILQADLNLYRAGTSLTAYDHVTGFTLRRLTAMAATSLRRERGTSTR